ncbi:MAG: Saccharopine dehydrogenase [Candidatus Angelobacter sp.]|jgi:lysine 6-dehydrogenase|nr:Saccharopine dehydrogenase [Candidatus Angelobacter sp.]
MKLLVIGAGMMGSAAAYDMARADDVESVTLADADGKLAKSAAARVNKLNGNKKIQPVKLDASNYKKAGKLIKGHAAMLSAVPYFFNVGLAKAAIDARCHFADLGGNNTVVRKTYELSKQAEKRGVALAPDCGLSPGMASILAGELFRRMAGKNGRVDALKLYVGGLPEDPQPPFYYQLVFSVNGLINEYVEPAKVLRNGKITQLEPLTETEHFSIPGFPPLIAFHTSGGTSTMPETFKGRVGECFEKTLRYPSHFTMIRSLYDLGFFSSKKMKIGKSEVTPREVTSQIFLDKFTSNAPDVCIMRIEAHKDGRVAAFSMVDHYDPATKMTAMMRTTAWPASIVVQMMARGTIAKRGGIKQEIDIPAELFLSEIEHRGIGIEYALQD